MAAVAFNHYGAVSITITPSIHFIPLQGHWGAQASHSSNKDKTITQTLEFNLTLDILGATKVKIIAHSDMMMW